MEKTILVIDDEPANIDLIKGILPSNFKIKAALNGHVALKIVDKALPDLILLDLMMPVMSGHEVLKELYDLGITNQIPIVILSGSISDKDIQQAETHGASGYLTKPVDSTELLHIINNLTTRTAP